MKDLAPHDRPREKLERLGAGALGDNELLALVLGSGSRVARRADAGQRAARRCGGLRGLTRAAADDLRLRARRRARARRAGAGGRRARPPHARARSRRAAAARHAAADRRAAAAAVRRAAGGAVRHRHARHQARMLRVRIVSIGSLDTTVVHPREVFREAAAASAAAIVLFHNHPSGDPAPSPDDLALTARMVKAGDDHGDRRPRSRDPRRPALLLACRGGTVAAGVTARGGRTRRNGQGKMSGL